jgi:hypothetical protein
MTREFTKRCDCKSILRWSQNGKQFRKKTGARSWAKAEEQKRRLENQLAGCTPVAVTGSPAPRGCHGCLYPGQEEPRRHGEGSRQIHAGTCPTQRVLPNCTPSTQSMVSLGNYSPATAPLGRTCTPQASHGPRCASGYGPFSGSVFKLSGEVFDRHRQSHYRLCVKQMIRREFHTRDSLHTLRWSESMWNQFFELDPDP